VRTTTPTGVVINSSTTDGTSFDLQEYDYGAIHIWSEGVTNSTGTPAAVVICDVHVKARWWLTERNTVGTVGDSSDRILNLAADHYQNSLSNTFAAGSTLGYQPLDSSFSPQPLAFNSGITNIVGGALNFLKTGVFEVANVFRFMDDAQTRAGGSMSAGANEFGSGYGLTGDAAITTGGAAILDDWDGGFATSGDGYVGGPSSSSTGAPTRSGYTVTDVVQISSLPATYGFNTGGSGLHAYPLVLSSIPQYFDTIVSEVPDVFVRNYIKKKKEREHRKNEIKEMLPALEKYLKRLDQMDRALDVKDTRDLFNRKDSFKELKDVKTGGSRYFGGENSVGTSQRARSADAKRAYVKIEIDENGKEKRSEDVFSDEDVAKLVDEPPRKLMGVIAPSPLKKNG